MEMHLELYIDREILAMIIVGIVMICLALWSRKSI